MPMRESATLPAWPPTGFRTTSTCVAPTFPRRDLEYFSGLGESHETPAAQCHLCAMTENSLPLDCDLFGRQKNFNRLSGYFVPARVNQILQQFEWSRVQETIALQGQLKQYGQRTVIGMQIAKRRSENQSGLPLADFGRKFINQFFATFQQLLGQPLIRIMPKRNGLRLHSEVFQSDECFALPSFSPAHAVHRFKTPSSLDESLRPWIIVTIGQENDADITPSCESMLNQAAGAQRFIVRMNGQHQHFFPG